MDKNNTHTKDDIIIPLVAYAQCVCKKTSREAAALAGFLTPTSKPTRRGFFNLKARRIPASLHVHDQGQIHLRVHHINREAISFLLFSFYSSFDPISTAIAFGLAHLACMQTSRSALTRLWPCIAAAATEV
jgi:hypothetical protein